MKILHIITGLNQGGAEGALTRLACADEQNTHGVVSLMDAGFHGPKLTEHGIAVYALGMPRGRVTMPGMSELLRVLRRERPDVVQTWMYHADLLGGVAARLCGVRALVWGIRHSNLDPQKTSRATRTVARSCALLSSVVPTLIVSCSRAAADHHMELGYARDKFRVVPNGFDCGVLRPDARARRRLRASWGVPEGAPLFGMIARWDPQKDHASLIRAFSAGPMPTHPSVRCALVGTGLTSDNADLMALLDASGHRDRFMLLGSRADVPDIMSALDVHVLSSCYGEAFPNVLAEAMACGAPCVATDVGDAAFIVGDNGIIVPPADVPALRRDEARNRIVENFSLESMLSRYRAVWEEARAMA